MRIDAHQHFWQLKRGDYRWITPNQKALYQNYLPEDLFPELQRHQIDGTVLVQAASTMEETEYMLNLYQEYPFITGVVGWIDLDSPDFANKFQYLKEKEGLVGFRPILESVEKQLALESPRVMGNIEMLVQADFPIDLLLVPRLLPLVIKLLDRFPTLRGVVNHAAKPQIRDKIFHPWHEQLQMIASYPNTMCKLSGLITEAADSWTQADIEPVVEEVIEMFGSERIMFGSDWPVCNGSGSYEQAYQVLLQSLPMTMTEEEKDKLFGWNAFRFYKNLQVNR